MKVHSPQTVRYLQGGLHRGLCSKIVRGLLLLGGLGDAMGEIWLDRGCGLDPRAVKVWNREVLLYKTVACEQLQRMLSCHSKHARVQFPEL